MSIIMDAFYKAHNNFPEGGTCLEFGVFEGHSYFKQVDAIINIYTTTLLIGFDSWEGLPDEDIRIWKPDRHSTGNFSCKKDIVINKLKTRGLLEDTRFKLVDGFYKDSLTKDLQFKINNLIFVNIDVDLYISCVQVLEFIKPMLRSGVVIYFDDWKDPIDLYDGKWGEHLAWEEFINKYPEIRYKTLYINESNQRYLEIE